MKRVADAEQVWGLYADGWALAAVDDGTTVLPFWRAEEYARECATGDCSGFEPEALDFDRLLELLARLEADGVLPGIFYTPDDKGVTPAVSQLREDLEAELSRYA